MATSAVNNRCSRPRHVRSPQAGGSAVHPAASGLARGAGLRARDHPPRGAQPQERGEGGGGGVLVGAAVGVASRAGELH